MRCNEVAGILVELMLGGPRQRVADRASWHEVEEHATHDLRCAIESLEEDPDLERGMGRRCDSCHGPSSTAFCMLSRHDLSTCSVLLRRHKDALVGTGSRKLGLGVERRRDSGIPAFRFANAKVGASRAAPAEDLD